MDPSGAAATTEQPAPRRPLVLTGPPAAGKSATARAIAAGRPRAALVDVDDVRQMVVSGGEPPWRGEEGRRQQVLGVQNACRLARGFLGAAIDVVIADVLTPATAPLYRRELDGCVVVHLVVDLDEAARRAATRPVWLTEAEFRRLHDDDRLHPPPADHRVDVSRLSLAQQAQAVEKIWAASSAG